MLHYLGDVPPFLCPLPFLATAKDRALLLGFLPAASWIKAFGINIQEVGRVALSPLPGFCCQFSYFFLSWVSKIFLSWVL